MPRFNPTESFNFSNQTEWLARKERFSRFRMASKLNKDDPEVQISALIYAMGKEAEHIFKSLQFAEAGDEKKFEKVLEKFNEYFIPKRNIIHEGARFHQRAQQSGESIETFVRSLHEISEFCDFTDKKEQIRDRLVIGISDKELSEKLQLRSDLTLEKAVEIARQSEMVKSQIKDQSVSSTNVEAVRKHEHGSQGRGQFSRGRGRGHRQSGRGRGNSHRTGQGQDRCTKCNLRHARDHCFA